MIAGRLDGLGVWLKVRYGNLMRCFVFAMLISTAAFADAFAVDSKNSELVVKTQKEGFASALAHNHVVQATQLSGELIWDAAAVEATRVSVTVQVASLVADQLELRKKHGQTTELSESDRKKVTEAMLGDDQLEAKKFPLITFVSTSALKDPKGVVMVGKFTLHGVTREVKVPARIEMKHGAVVGDAAFRLRVSDYKIQPFSTALGSIRNADEVELVLHLVGTKSGALGAEPLRGPAKAP